MSGVIHLAECIVMKMLLDTAAQSSGAVPPRSDAITPRR